MQNIKLKCKKNNNDHPYSLKLRSLFHRCSLRLTFLALTRYSGDGLKASLIETRVLELVLYKRIIIVIIIKTSLTLFTTETPVYASYQAKDTIVLK